MSFFFTKTEQEDKTGPVWGIDASGRGEDIWKECMRVNMVEIIGTHIWKWRNEVC
jgi:hypothetical protein